jgi:hypothetical protein
MADATRFRNETAEIASRAGWHVTPMGDIDKFTQADVSIEVVYSAKDYISELFRDGPGNEHLHIPKLTVGKIDLLRLWLTGRRSNVISASVKRAAGVDW